MSHAHSWQHFTGTKKGKKVRRKGKGKSRAQRKANRGSHHNRYGEFAGRSINPRDKEYRDLALQGDPGTTITAGTAVLWHGRRYRILQDLVIPTAGVATAKCKLAR